MGKKGYMCKKGYKNNYNFVISDTTVTQDDTTVTQDDTTK